MWIITGIAFIIFAANIAKAECDEGNSIIDTYKVTDGMKVPKNQYIEQKGDDSIVWKKDVNKDSKIDVYLIDKRFDEPKNLGKLCGISNARIQKILEFFFANEKPCPIQKGTTSSLKREYKETIEESDGGSCKTENVVLALIDTETGDALIHLPLEITSSGKGCS